LRGSRWKFEQNGPAPGTSREAWLNRAPLPPTPTAGGAHGWHAGFDVWMRPVIRQYIADNRKSRIFDLVDYRSVMQLLDRPGHTEAAIAEGIFGLVTILHFLGSAARACNDRCGVSGSS
jgi:hypothetical protein